MRRGRSGHHVDTEGAGPGEEEAKAGDSSQRRSEPVYCQADAVTAGTASAHDGPRPGLSPGTVFVFCFCFLINQYFILTSVHTKVILDKQ